ncbi:protein kinase domain-containing protein [Sorangium sp. So ce1024]|uniref:serine/threonine-protein kinase n=1 Tax=Sorangium sp. So ce1024 TaxID=3133327 RepID=UPI003F0EB834
MENARQTPCAAESTVITASLPPAALIATEELSSSLPWSSVDPGKERDSDVSDAGEPIERQVFEPGQVFHQVEIVRFIGAGYSGEVYEVRHRITGARCALKIMHLRDRKDARKAERSLAEAHGTFGIQHANVVDVFDIGCEADGTAWMLMEFLDGPTLATVLERQGRLSPLFALHVALEVAWGLDAAHENQIIHRDVKPDNIAFTADGSVKVVDFSIAKVIPYEMRTTQRNVRLGTCAYMAPENLDGAEADARFDIYSLGLVLWEMMAGRHPFHDAFHDRTLLVRRQFFTDPEPLSEVAGLPDYVDEVIRRATAKQAAARYLTMAEMAQALIALRGRLEKDEAEGRISLVVPPGEPPIPGRSRSRAVYRPPVTGPTLEVPRPEPSAKVVVASPAPALGPCGTVPVDRESVRAAAFGPGPRDAEGDGRAPGSAGRTARGTEIMPAADRASLSRPPPTGASRPPAARTTSPMLRQVAAETERAAGERGDGAHGRREVRMAPWMLIALVLSSSVASALAVRWIAPAGRPSGDAPPAAQSLVAPAVEGGAAAAGEAAAGEAAPVVAGAAAGVGAPLAATSVGADAAAGAGAPLAATPVGADAAAGAGAPLAATSVGADAAAGGVVAAPPASRRSPDRAASEAARSVATARGGAAAPASPAASAAARGGAAAPVPSRAAPAPGPHRTAAPAAPSAPRRGEPRPFGDSPLF